MAKRNAASDETKYGKMADALGIEGHLTQAITSLRAARRIVETVNAAAVADGREDVEADPNGVLSYVVENALPGATRAAVAIITRLDATMPVGVGVFGTAFEVSLACHGKLPHRVLTSVALAFERFAKSRADYVGEEALNGRDIVVAETREDARDLLRGMASNGDTKPAEGV